MCLHIISTIYENKIALEIDNNAIAVSFSNVIGELNENSIRGLFVVVGMPLDLWSTVVIYGYGRNNNKR